MFFSSRDNLAHILRALARRDQDRIVGFDDDQVLHADQRDCLSRREDVAAGGRDLDVMLRFDDVRVVRLCALGNVLMQSGP